MFPKCAEDAGPYRGDARTASASSILPIPANWTATDAVGAIITVGREYLLQLRDDRPEIWYPGYWGLFGGTVEGGETSVMALLRELTEELSLQRVNPAYFMNMGFDFGALGEPIRRDIFEVQIEPSALPHLKLGEGRQMRLWPAAAIPELSLVPADRLALDFHICRATDRVRRRQ